jgi:hypothetical protein
MAYYVRKFASRDYFMGFQRPLQPLLGLPEWALPFPSEKAAFDCVPGFLHSDMEVVGDDSRRKDCLTVRIQRGSGGGPEDNSPDEFENTKMQAVVTIRAT